MSAATEATADPCATSPAPERAGDFITLLASTEGKVLAKRVSPEGVKGYDSATFFTIATRPLKSFDDLGRLLEKLQSRRHVMVVRGKLIGAERAENARRLLHQKDGNAPTLEPAPHRWVAIDLDGVALPAGTDRADVAACGKVVLPLLPAEFRAARCFVSASGSHGFKDGARLRFWFWMNVPLGREALREWFVDSPVDHSLFNDVTPIYTAAPALNGVEDPCPARFVELPGEAEVTVPPRIAEVVERSTPQRTATEKVRGAAVLSFPDGAPDQRFLAAVAPDALADLFRQIQNDGRFDERDSGYVKIGCALKAALPQHLEMARELYIEFDGRYHRGGDSTEAERTFNSLAPPFFVGTADILEWAEEAGADTGHYLRAVREIRMAEAQEEFADTVEPMPPELRKRHARPDLIVDNGDLPETAERPRDALAAAGNLFERDKPVVVVRNADGFPEVHHLGADRAVIEAHRICRPMAIGKDGPKSTTLPDRVAKLYLAMRGDWHLPALHGFALGPLLADDGSIRHACGYDPITKLWCASGVSVQVPDRPDEGDALIALHSIRHAFRTFAVADAERVHEATLGVDVTDVRVDPGQDESALLCGLLTAVVRPSIDLAPGFLVHAPEISGSSVGKGLLVRAICAVAFGRSPQAFTAGADLAELEKRIVAALLEAEPAVFLD